jgi:hypothetical protein
MLACGVKDHGLANREDGSGKITCELEDWPAGHDAYPDSPFRAFARPFVSARTFAVTLLQLGASPANSGVRASGYVSLK